MYFWNVKRLREELIENSLNEKNQMIYLLLTMILYALSGQLSGSEYTGGFFFAETIAVLSSTIIGILYCYDGNKAGDGIDFIKRFTCVSWIVTVRVTTIVILVGLVSIFLFNEQIDAYFKEPNKYFDIIGLIAFEALYFWRINAHLKYISAKSGAL